VLLPLWQIIKAQKKSFGNFVGHNRLRYHDSHITREFKRKKKVAKSNRKTEKKKEETSVE